MQRDGGDREEGGEEERKEEGGGGKKGGGGIVSILGRIYGRGRKAALTRADAGMIMRLIDNAFERLAGKRGMLVMGRRCIAFDGEMAFLFPKHKKVYSLVTAMVRLGFLEPVSEKPKVFVGEGPYVAAVVIYRNEVVIKRRWSEGIDEFILSVLSSRSA